MNFEERSAFFGQLKDEICEFVKNSKFRKELEFLYSTMPLSDVGNYPPELFEAYAEHGRFLRENVEWCKNLSEEQYLNDVLYHRINSEDITNCRRIFYDKLWNLVKNKSLEDAIKAINYWCLEEATYRLTDDRTVSPETVLRCGFGRCGEESTFTVTAFRSVGIAARQVYSPKWPHCDDNHAWVEVFCDGKWHYLGACEPEESLDRGWFTVAASRAMLVHSRNFGEKLQSDEYISSEGCVNLYNQLSRYAETTNLTVKIVENNQAKSGVLVKCELLNYAQFSPIAKQFTDENGMVNLTVGKGDLRVHCVQNNKFIVKNIDLRNENLLIIDWNEAVLYESDELQGFDFEMNPPADNTNFLQPQSEEIKLLRQKKFDECVAKRKKKEEGYLTEKQALDLLISKDFSYDFAKSVSKILCKTYGNHNEILKFLNNCEDKNLRLAMLQNLSEKDWYDCSFEVLEDAFSNTIQYKNDFPEEVFVKYIQNMRVGLENLTKHRYFLKTYFSNEEKAIFIQNPQTIADWIVKNIEFDEKQEYSELLTNPIAALKLFSANSQSKSILFVNICRSLGIPARLAPDDKRPQFWNKISKEFCEISLNDDFERGNIVNFKIISECDENWVYTQNWSLSRLENGEYLCLNLQDKIWENGILNLRLTEGYYKLIVCKRMPTGSLFAKEYRFYAGKNCANCIKIQQRMAKLTDILSDKPIPNFTLYDENNLPVNMEKITENKSSLLMWLQEANEPTEHILNEISVFSDKFKAINAQIIFILRNTKSKENDKISEVLAKVPNIKVLYDDFRDTMSMLARRMYIDPDKLPIIVICNKNLNGIYANSGYNVGMGDLILKIFDELNKK